MTSETKKISKGCVASLTDLVDTLEQMYPNNALLLQEQDNKDEYIGKLKLIREIKYFIGADENDK